MEGPAFNVIFDPALAEEDLDQMVAVSNFVNPNFTGKGALNVRETILSRINFKIYRVRRAEKIFLRNKQEDIENEPTLADVLFPESDELKRVHPMVRYIGYLRCHYEDKEAAEIMMTSYASLFNSLRVCTGRSSYWPIKGSERYGSKKD